MRSPLLTIVLGFVACAGKSMDPPTGSASTTAGDTSPLPSDPACEIPTSVSTTETDDGCYALVLTAGTNLPDGSFVTRDLCSANEYGMSCRSSSELNPTPDPSLGCTFPSGGEGFGADTQYCCPCSTSSAAGGGGSPGDAGSSGSGATCTGGAGGGSYTLQASETSDGTTYQVSCDCPAATCTCAESSGQSGGGGGGVAFSACAEDCSPASVSAAYEACGFPH
ncbi:MAG: hypothetical protein ACLQVI_39060 [Polyangiaceae bacterium]